MQRIALYKRYISPHKGFACAYRVHTGGCSCSTLGARAIRRFGLMRGLGVLSERTYLCGVAQRRHEGCAPQRRPQSLQRGDCDLGGCDLPNCDGPWGRAACNACDVLDCCSSCDNWRRRDRKPAQGKRRQTSERDVHLPGRRARADGSGGARST
ncbi:membrane protein insertion efficiency factor YidD [Ideonella sp.]|uniref:membrane protein insertion efficiency factor YidD n=1 Tax=Ideonella sp. TaxID=1929293 RepID=UPI003BB64806